MKWGLLAIVLLPNCIHYPTVEDTARERATLDLRCPSMQIAVYDTADGSTVASGCGVWTGYQCFHVHYGFVCVREGAPQIYVSPPPSAAPPPPAPTVAVDHPSMSGAPNPPGGF
jgi:hypothetical protein